MPRSTLLLLTVLLAACATAPYYPPIVETPTDAWRPGSFVFYDLMTSDPAAAKHFYGELFGWTFATDGDYTVVRHGGRVIGGIAARPEAEEKEDAEWVPSLSHPDPFRAAEAIAASGGRIEKGPANLRGRGAFALVTDPQGASLILLRSNDGDPAAREAVEGEWFWTVLWTTKPEASIGFYESLTGWESRPISSPEQIRYWVFGDGNEVKAGVAGVRGDERKALWLPAVLVADPNAVCDAAAAAGGRVIVAPGEPPSDGNTALIADPGGAVFLVEKWRAGREVK